MAPSGQVQSVGRLPNTLVGLLGVRRAVARQNDIGGTTAFQPKLLSYSIHFKPHLTVVQAVFGSASNAFYAYTNHLSTIIILIRRYTDVSSLHSLAGSILSRTINVSLPFCL